MTNRVVARVHDFVASITDTSLEVVDLLTNDREVRQISAIRSKLLPQYAIPVRPNGRGGTAYWVTIAPEGQKRHAQYNISCGCCLAQAFSEEEVDTFFYRCREACITTLFMRHPNRLQRKGVGHAYANPVGAYIPPAPGEITLVEWYYHGNRFLNARETNEKIVSAYRDIQEIIGW